MKKPKIHKQRCMGWHFSAGKLSYGDDRLVRRGTIRVPTAGEGQEILLCNYGLHASPKILDAFQYAKGNVLSRCIVHGPPGEYSRGHDKVVGSHRTVKWWLPGEMVDEVLREFGVQVLWDLIPKPTRHRPSPWIELTTYKVHQWLWHPNWNDDVLKDMTQHVDARGLLHHRYCMSRVFDGWVKILFVYGNVSPMSVIPTLLDEVMYAREHGMLRGLPPRSGTRIWGEYNRKLERAMINKAKETKRWRP